MVTYGEPYGQAKHLIGITVVGLMTVSFLMAAHTAEGLATGPFPNFRQQVLPSTEPS
jgi:hypothetical protein